MIATRNRDSDRYQRFERRRLHEHARAFDFDHLAALEIAEQARDGFARRADHLRDFFVREEHLQADAFRRFLAAAGAPVEEEARQFFGRALGEPEAADLALRGVILLAQLLRGVHAGLGMRIEESYEVLAADEVDLRRLQRFRGDL